MIPLMSVTRNFFLGREPKKGFGPFRFFDFETADRIAMDELARMGIGLRNPPSRRRSWAASGSR